VPDYSFLLILQYTRWCVENGGLGVATDLAMACVLKAAEPNADVQSDPYAPHPTVREACLTLKEFFSASPKHYSENGGIASLSGMYQN